MCVSVCVCVSVRVCECVSVTQCLLPVYDILAEEPLCTKHK